MEIALTVAEHFVSEARRQEREECAKLAESFAIQGLRYKNAGDMALAIAEAIRKRQEK